MSQYLTRAQAEAQGLTIDDTAPGRPFAYKGRRFAPTAQAPVLTELEEQLLEACEIALSIIGFGKEWDRISATIAKATGGAQ